MPTRKVHRPELARLAIESAQDKLSVPDDILNLWNCFSELSPELRRQFLQAAAKYQEAQIHWPNRASLSFALMVVASEALKSHDPRNKLTIYHVVEELLGKGPATRLKSDGIRAQFARTQQLHTGKFLNSEFLTKGAHSAFVDPAFRDAFEEVYRVSSAAIVQWLLTRKE